MTDSLIFGTNNLDTISPNTSNNTIFAGEGNDLIDISQSSGNNRVYGGSGNDKIIANINDTIFGGDGNDQLFTGNGNNIISGGKGNDLFWLVENGNIPENLTTITDFTPNTDKIIINNVTGISSINDLTLVSQENGTLIKIEDQNLAVLLGVNKDNLTNSDFVFENSPPILTAYLANDTGVSNTDKNTNDPTITGNLIESNLSSLKAKLNNNTIDLSLNNNGTFSITKDKLTELNNGNLPDGDYNLSLIAIDITGNKSEVTVNFTLDTIAPTISINNPNLKLSQLTPQLENNAINPSPENITLVTPYPNWSNYVFKQDLSNLTGTVNDENLSSINYQLNNNNPTEINFNENGQFSEPLALQGLENTYPNLTITATDLAGNIITDNRILGVILTTETGLGYLDITVGTGDSPDPNNDDKDYVTVHYTGNFLDGEVFDSSRDRGQPSTFSLNQVIKGFKDGIDTMNIGGRRILFIPDVLGYGEPSETNPSPLQTTLIFDVELFGIS